MLGFDEYIESHADGLQILRYNLTTAYSKHSLVFIAFCLHDLHFLTRSSSFAKVPHLDFLDIDEKFEHDYDSAGRGGNRFATILLYMTDLDEKDGGETVFTEAWPTGQAEEDHVDIKTVCLRTSPLNRHLLGCCQALCGLLKLKLTNCLLLTLSSGPTGLQALRELRESDRRGILKEGSWEENMVRAHAFARPCGYNLLACINTHTFWLSGRTMPFQVSNSPEFCSSRLVLFTVSISAGFQYLNAFAPLDSGTLQLFVSAQAPQRERGPKVSSRSMPNLIGHEGESI